MPRIDALIHTEVGRYVSRDFEPPAGALLTIEEVSTTRDLTIATIAVSVLPVALGKQAVDALNGAAPHMRHILSKRLVMKTVPRLIFRLDDREERADHMHRVLDDAAKDE